MRNGKVFRAAAWGLALGLAALTATAHADDKEPKKVEKRRVVVVDKDGKRQVFEGDGPMMRRGYLGVGLTELTPELRTHFGVPEDAGAMVAKVEPGSPAEKAGIKVGDILTSVDGQDVKSSWDVMRKVRPLDDGQQVPVEIWRNGKAQNLTVTIVQKERPEFDMGPLFWKEGDGEPKILHLDKDKLLKDWPKGRGGLGVLSPEGRRLVTPRELELEKKLKELEKRIDELERQLGKQKG
ncbi:MAG TPA: PDZ domain-containing protein [Thermoanaerobaculia bacterium]|jgi:membrane-associated protease RseP (regulator of RpoE activity)